MVGMNPLRGQNNVQGANDAGATPTFMPGHERIADPAVRERYEKAWGVSLSPDEGLNLNVMMKELARGNVKGLYVMGEAREDWRILCDFARAVGYPMPDWMSNPSVCNGPVPTISTRADL